MLKLVCTGLCLTMFSLSSDVMARVYKCKDATGNITYSQTTCAASSDQKQLSSSRKSISVDATTCKMVGQAAHEIFSEVASGKDAQAIFQTYGGLSAMNPRMLNLINYVAGFRLHEGVRAERVVQLSMTKCRSGGLGAMSINDLQFQDPMLAHQANMANQRQQTAKQYQALSIPNLMSVNFQNTPLVEALTLISKQVGVAFEIDPAIRGEVSLRMDNVPWPQVVGRLAIEHKLLMGQGANGIMISTMPER